MREYAPLLQRTNVRVYTRNEGLFSWGGGLCPALRNLGAVLCLCLGRSLPLHVAGVVGPTGTQRHDVIDDVARAGPA